MNRQPSTMLMNIEEQMNVEDHNMAINSKETPQFNMQHMHHLKKNLDIIKKDPSRRP